MTPALAAALAWAAEIAWQAALVGACVLAADAALRRAGTAPLRHALWLLVLVRFAVPPWVAAPWSPAAWLREPVATSAAGATVERVAGLDASAAASGTAASLAQWLLALWAAGTCVLAAGTAARAALRRREIDRAALAAPEAIRAAFLRAARRMRVARPPRLVVSAAARGVALAGLLRPVVIVPAGAAADAALDHALLHEMAHHRRRDLLVATFATAVRCAFWWHPVAWLAASRVAELREVCCDLDAARALGDGARDYRATLLGAARRLVGETPRTGLAWIGPRTALAARIEALAHPLPRASAGGRVLSALVVATAAACALPLGAPAAAALRGPSADDVALARQVLADHAAGDVRVSCFRLRFAAAALAAAAESPSPPAR